MEAYSMDLRIRVMAEIDAGCPAVEVARKFWVSTDWIRKLKRLRKSTGTFAPRKQRTSHATKLDAELPKLRELREAQPDATVEELTAQLQTKVSVSTVQRALHQLGFTFKKRPSWPQNSNGKMLSCDARPGNKLSH